MPRTGPIRIRQPRAARAGPRARWLLWLVALLLAPAALQGQQAGVTLGVRLTPDTAQRGHRNPVIGARNLLTDERWTTMLRSGFPLRLHFRAEMWRSRSAWFDVMVRQVEWDVVVRHEPLLDQYAVNTIMPGLARESRYDGVAALARALDGVQYQIAFRRPAPGEYYYVASLQVTSLSDQDLDELERFLRGDPGDSTTGRDFGDAVGRGATRLLLRLAGLPNLRVEGRSERFRVQ